MKFKAILSGLLVAVLYYAASGMDPDAGSELAQLEKELDELHREYPAEAFHDPSFVFWYERQFAILERLSANIRFDQKNKSELVRSELDDFHFMVRRLKEEAAFFAAVPASGSGGSEPGGEVNVRDYGARGDGVTNDGPAIRAAIADAIASGARCVRIPAGRYLLEKAPEVTLSRGWASRMNHHPEFDNGGKKVSAHLVIEAENLAVVGEEGTELICGRALDVAIYVRNSTAVQVRNLKISYRAPAYSNGVIIGFSGEDGLDVEMEPGAADPTQSYFRESGFKGLCRIYSEACREEGRPRYSSDGPYIVAPEVTHLSGRIFRFRLKNFLPVQKHYRLGQHLSYYGRTFGNHAVQNISSDRTRFENITVTGSSAMAFFNFGCNMPFYINCRVEPLPGNWTSTAADGIYLLSTGFGGLIRNCRLRYLGDDFFNIHNRMSPIYRQEGNVLYMPMSIWSDDKRYAESGRISVMRASRNESGVFEEYRIVRREVVPFSADEPQRGLVKLTLEKEPPALVTMTMQREPGTLLDMAGPGDFNANGLVIDGNRFEHGLSRVLLGGRNLDITGNVYLDSLNHSFLFLAGGERVTDTGCEGRLPRNLLFEGNRIEGKTKTLFEFTSYPNPKLDISAKYDKFDIAHFFIRGNEFLLEGNYHTPLFRLRNGWDLQVTGNRVRLDGEISAPVFQLDRLDFITISGNQFDGKSAGFVRVGAGVEHLTENNNSSNQSNRE